MWLFWNLEERQYAFIKLKRNICSKWIWENHAIIKYYFSKDSLAWGLQNFLFVHTSHLTLLSLEFIFVESFQAHFYRTRYVLEINRDGSLLSHDYTDHSVPPTVKIGSIIIKLWFYIKFYNFYFRQTNNMSS
jgi:hypothetical protein